MEGGLQVQPFITSSVRILNSRFITEHRLSEKLTQRAVLTNFVKEKKNKKTGAVQARESTHCITKNLLAIGNIEIGMYHMLYSYQREHQIRMPALITTQITMKVWKFFINRMVC